MKILISPLKIRNIKMENIEIEYINKLEQAIKEENYDKIQILFYELKFYRKLFKKKGQKNIKKS